VLIVLALLAAGVPVRTFRVDYVHSGTASEERFALERLVLEPLPWPGNPDRTVDDTDSGKNPGNGTSRPIRITRSGPRC